jgi:hypothetical protein
MGNIPIIIGIVKAAVYSKENYKHIQGILNFECSYVHMFICSYVHMFICSNVQLFISLSSPSLLLK